MFLNKRTGTFSVSSLEYCPQLQKVQSHRWPLRSIGQLLFLSKPLGVKQAAPSIPELGKETWVTDPFYKWANPRPECPPPPD